MYSDQALLDQLAIAMADSPHEPILDLIDRISKTIQPGRRYENTAFPHSRPIDVPRGAKVQWRLTNSELLTIVEKYNTMRTNDKRAASRKAN
jgi:hypothetical protein